MKFTLLFFSAAALVSAQSVDTVSATKSGVCEPHNDHWHCPAGVPEPTTPPALAATTSRTSVSASASHSHDGEDNDHDHAVTASTCEPHGNHWHCPSGVAEPATKPAASATSSRAGSNVAANASAAASATASPAAGAKVGSGAVLAVAGALGAWIL